MSSSTPNIDDRRLSSNGKNAYIVVNSPTNNNNINFYDPQKHKYYLTARSGNDRFPLSNESAPNKENNIKENKNKQTNMPTVDEKSNVNRNTNNINPINNNDSEKSPVIKNIDSPSFSKSNNTGAIPKTKMNNNPENNASVQTGMDRYITITKRKSSPRTSSLAPNPKQQKPNAVSQNRFAILSNQENDSAPVNSAKNFKPPPIYLREPTSNVLVKALTELLGKENFHVVSLRKGNVSETKIQTYSETKYRSLVEGLDNENKNYYTYQLKSSKGLMIVLKGIDSSVPCNEIKEALESEGYEVKSVHNIINKNKIPQPLFKVEISFSSSQLKKKGDTHPIYDLRFLLNRRITVEEPIKRKGPPQCTNCQEFGHTKSFCKLPSVCVICGDIHKSLECPYSKSENNYKKCGNCGQNHTANYRGCPVYLQLKEGLKTKKTVYAQYQNSYFPNLPVPQDGSNNYTQIPYAHTMKNGSVTKFNQNRNEIVKNQSKEGLASQIKNIGNNSHLFSYAQALKEGSAIPQINSENNARLFSNSKALKEGLKNPRLPTSTENNARLFSSVQTLNEGSAIPDTNTQSSIEKLIETMNSFMVNMQNMFQQMMQNQSMLMQILLNKK